MVDILGGQPFTGLPFSTENGLFKRGALIDAWAHQLSLVGVSGGPPA